MARWDEGKWGENRGRWGEEDRWRGREGWRGSEGRAEGWRGTEGWRGEEDRGSGGWREGGGRDWREEGGGGWRGEHLRSGERRTYMPRGREHEWEGRDYGRRDEGWFGRDRDQGSFGRERDEGWFGRDYANRDDDWRRSRERMGRDEWGREDRDRDWRGGGRDLGMSTGGMGGMYGGGYGAARDDFGRGGHGGGGYGGGGFGGGGEYRQGGGEYGYGGQDQSRWEGRGEEREPRGLGERMREGWRKMTGKGPKGYKRSDDRVREDVCERIARAGIDADDVEVQVSNGEVTLTGTVDDRSAKRRLEDVAEDVFGVEEVHNHLRMRREDRSAMGTTGTGVTSTGTSGTAGQTTQTTQSGLGGQQTGQRSGTGTTQTQPGTGRH